MRVTSGRRWVVVALVTSLLVALPVVLRSLPAAQSDVSASRLLGQVRDSSARGWSGFVITQGTLGLPSVEHFDDVASLFGATTQLRAWWQDGEHWRVDRIAATGETDLVHTGATTTQYDYEDAEASVSTDPSVRLPRTADLLPPVLARRALDGVGATQVSRIAARRVAGVSAPGLRVVPASSESSVDHVDLWADPRTGVPLRVEVYATRSGAPAFTSTFRDFTAGRPADDRVGFTATPTTRVRHDSVLDIADAVNQYAPLVPPRTVAGLAATSATDGAVGVYGGGLTQLVTIPLRDREADALRTQLLVTPDVVQQPGSTSVQEGVLGVLITGDPGDGGVLIAGTVTAQTLQTAAHDVTTGYRFRRG